MKSPWNFWVKNVYGLATIVSIERGKGYGKEIVVQIKKFVESAGKVGIGFCNKGLTEFYKSCGLGIISDGTPRFLYKDDNDNLIKDPWGGGDVIYIENSDDLIEMILSRPDKKVISYRQHW